MTDEAVHPWASTCTWGNTSMRAGPGVLLGLARAMLSVVIVLSSSYIMRWP